MSSVASFSTHAWHWQGNSSVGCGETFRPRLAVILATNSLNFRGQCLADEHTKGAREGSAGGPRRYES
jgi:hypothetical protein